jgi:hypothetical protein
MHPLSIMQLVLLQCGIILFKEILSLLKQSY